MFDALLRLLSGLNEGRTLDERNDPAVALAALLIETARSDHGIGRRERRIIEQLLARRFGLAAAEVNQLIAAAAEAALAATDLFHFTRVVAERFGEPERVSVIEMMWEVALSDGELSGDEDALIRRVAGLIYVSDHDRGEARQRASQRLAGA